MLERRPRNDRARAQPDALDTALGRPSNRRSRPPAWLRTRSVLVASVVLAVLVAPIAVGATGNQISLGGRNPSSGPGATGETAIVANIGNNGQSTRQSNNAKGGRAAGYGCDNDGKAEINACANYVNRGQGPAAAFRTRGSVPFVIRDTNRGLVENLNADLLDDKHASDFLGRNDQAADAAKLGGKLPSDYLGRTEKAADSAKLDGLNADQIGRESWASVSVTGPTATLDRGNGATRVVREDIGSYRVQFSRDVSTCSYQVTPASVDQNLTAAVAADTTSAQGVLVSLRDPSTATRTDGAFNLAVVC